MKILRFSTLILLGALNCIAKPGSGSLKIVLPQIGLDTSASALHLALFIPGKIPITPKRSAAPAFSPDGKTVYFGAQEGSKDITLMESKWVGGTWSAPVKSSFSGDYKNLEPAFSPDGKYMIFASNRPVKEGGAILDGTWGGKLYSAKGGHLWKIGFSNKSISAPELLPENINSSNSTFSPAVTADGSLYFMRADSGKKFHIYRSQFKNGSYQTPVRASFCLDSFSDFDPAVAPDESFLIYSTGRPPSLPNTSDVFIVFKTPTGWSEPVDLRTNLNGHIYGVEVRLSPDLKTLYFSNSRNAAGVEVPDEQYVWQIDIGDFIKAYKK